MNPERIRPRRSSTYGPALLLLAGIAAFALLGRGRWANVNEDHGFWFSAVEGLLSGGRAMHEVRVQYGPVSLWALEAVCRIFGATAGAIVVFQLVVGALALLGLLLFSRRFLSAGARWVAAAGLVVLIAWMAGPGNLLYPCAFAMSHGLLLLVAALSLHDVCMRRGAWGGAVATGALAAVAFLTKQEFGLAAVAGIAVLTLLAPRISGGRKIASLLLVGVGFAGAYFGILEIARDGGSFRHLVAANILWPWAPVPPAWRALFVRNLGLDDPARRLLEAGDAFVTLAAFGGTVWLLLYGSLLRRGRALLAVVALTASWVLWAWRWTEGSQFLPMTLTLPAILLSGVVAARAARGAPDAGERLGPFFALWVGAILLLQREGYRGSIEAYYSGIGYVLAVPVVAPLIWVAACGPRSAGRRRGVAAAVLLLLAARFGAGRLEALQAGWKNSVPFTTPRGTLYFQAGSAAGLADTARFLEAHTRPGEPILVLPSTFGLDFLLDRPNLTFFPYASPGYLSEEGEKELVARCEKRPPAAAVVFERSFAFLRSGDYGRGFAPRLIGWIRASFPNRGRFAFGQLTGARYWR